jgi:hypothetical protein
MTPVRLRILHIRRIVAACAVAVFIAVFSTIYVQMASGNDPQLAANGRSTATSTATASSDPTAGAAPAPVTTQQS